MSRYRKDVGDFGESVAEKFYKKQGFRLLTKNYSVKGGELDLIVESKDLLVFVEVKTRSNTNYGLPAESITQKKLMHMRRAAESFLQLHPCEKEIRFDAFEVYIKNLIGIPVVEKINHIPGIIF